MITIYGASDDLIEVEGDIREEFGHDGEHPALLAISDGTLLRVVHDAEGVWRISTVRKGSAAITHVPGQDDREHTDKVTLDGVVSWVVYTSEQHGHVVKALAPAASTEFIGAAE
jgi:hypothetical protein